MSEHSRPGCKQYCKQDAAVVIVAVYPSPSVQQRLCVCVCLTRPLLQASETRAAELTTELGVTRDELARAAAVANRAAAAEAKLVKGEGVVPAGVGAFIPVMSVKHASLHTWLLH
jgi:hypothetical protein